MSPKSIEIGRKRVHVKDDGKSSSEKLRRVAGYLFYVRDPQKKPLKFTCSIKLSKTGKLQILGPQKYIKLPINRTIGYYVTPHSYRRMLGLPVCLL